MTVLMTRCLCPTNNTFVNGWGGHQLNLSSSFLSSPICLVWLVSFCSSLSTTLLPSASKRRKWSTLSTAATRMRFWPTIGIPLTSLSEDIKRRSHHPLIPSVSTQQEPLYWQLLGTDLLCRPSEGTRGCLIRRPWETRDWRRGRPRINRYNRHRCRSVPLRRDPSPQRVAAKIAV